jgi:hypothetical protein
VVEEDELGESHRLFAPAVLEHPEYRWKWFGNIQASPDGVFDLGGEARIAVGMDVQGVDGLAFVARELEMQRRADVLRDHVT